MIKLILADDDAKVRSAINLLLDQDQACWHVVAEVCSVNDLFLKVEEEKPQLLLLDWELPEECRGDKQPPFFVLEDRIKQLRKINPRMYIIVLSSEPQVKAQALESGANSFVSKGDPPEVFLTALYEICSDPASYFNKKPRKKSTQSYPISIFY